MSFLYLLPSVVQTILCWLPGSSTDQSLLFGYAQSALNADATFEFCPHECDKGLLPTILLWVDGMAVVFDRRNFCPGIWNVIHPFLLLFTLLFWCKLSHEWWFALVWNFSPLVFIAHSHPVLLTPIVKRYQMMSAINSDVTFVTQSDPSFEWV